ncbi:MAG: UDP-3-O-acyl-N-acetylglucosamine deacetylase [Rhodospirillales bacterium]|nr:UDP-3-O-acyl-N-acetylglucosamine deacetylase [Rhodospirillales bacterium]
MGFSEIRRRRVETLTEERIDTQKTLKSPIGCSGVALHTGAKVSMILKPAEAGHGIVFRRTDIAGKGAIIPARWDHVVDTRLCTVVGNGEGIVVSTIEHLMAALAGCGIDNAEIEINGPEVPVMDGSAEPFVFLIECAGVRDLGVARRGLRVLKPVVVDGGASGVAALYPADTFSVGFEIDFDSALVGRQALLLGLVNGTFKKELARARTFGFLHEVEQLWANGFARGGSLENAVVVSGDKVLNEDGLRYEDEFVRHKALDAVGDLYTAGAPIIGRFDGRCSGHALTNRLLRQLFAEPDAWCYDTVKVAAATAPAMPVSMADNIPVGLAATA